MKWRMQPSVGAEMEGRGGEKHLLNSLQVKERVKQKSWERQHGVVEWQSQTRGHLI